MPLIQFVMVLITVGVLLWLVNNYHTDGESHQVYLECRRGDWRGLVAARYFWIHAHDLQSPRGQVTIDRSKWVALVATLKQEAHLRPIGKLRARELKKRVRNKQKFSSKQRVSGTALETLFRLGCCVESLHDPWIPPNTLPPGLRFAPRPFLPGCGGNRPAA